MGTGPVIDKIRSFANLHSCPELHASPPEEWFIMS